MSDAPVVTRPVEISSIGSTELSRRLETTEDERARLAELLDLVDVLALSAEFELHRDAQNTVLIDGRLRADIVQNCIVSLEPVNQAIDETIQLRLIESGERDRSETSKDAAAVDIDPTQDDPPEVVAGSLIDLGALAVEHLILAIDPYPRAPGAVLPDNPAQGRADSRESPFAALADILPADPQKR